MYHQGVWSVRLRAWVGSVASQGMSSGMRMAEPRVGGARKKGLEGERAVEVRSESEVVDNGGLVELGGRKMAKGIQSGVAAEGNGGLGDWESRTRFEWRLVSR